MNISYDYYRIFYYVVQYKSFTQAAKVLGNNQPNITRSMNNLESQLGCRLFIRSNRGVRLTPEGEQLFSHISVAFEQIHAAEMELSSQKNLQHGLITIGASETALHTFLLYKLNQFHKLYPGIRIRILNHTTLQAIEALKQGLIDLAITSSPEKNHPSLRETPLETFREIPVCSKEYPALITGTHSLKELTTYPLICLGRETLTFQFYTQFFLSHGLTLQPDIEAATTDLILPMIQNHLGIGFVPESFAKEALSKGKVYPITLQEKIPNRTICLIKETNHPLSIAASQFEKFLTES